MVQGRGTGGMAAWLVALALVVQSVLAAAHFHPPAHRSLPPVATASAVPGDSAPEQPAEHEDGAACGLCILLHAWAGGLLPLAATIMAPVAVPVAGAPALPETALAIPAYSRPFGRGPPEHT